MLVGKTPYKGNTQLVTFQNIKNNKLEIPEQINREAADLIGKLLRTEPTERIGSVKFEEIKEHPFFIGINFDHIRE